MQLKMTCPEGVVHKRMLQSSVKCLTQEYIQVNTKLQELQEKWAIDKIMSELHYQVPRYTAMSDQRSSTLYAVWKLYRL